jgi:hypothetical protein
MPPRVAAAMALSAWRREVEVAKALVKSSKRSGFISVPSFRVRTELNCMKYRKKQV